MIDGHLLVDTFPSFAPVHTPLLSLSQCGQSEQNILKYLRERGYWAQSSWLTFGFVITFTSQGFHLTTRLSMPYSCIGIVIIYSKVKTTITITIINITKLRGAFPHCAGQTGQPLQWLSCHCSRSILGPVSPFIVSKLFVCWRQYKDGTTSAKKMC